MEWDMPEKEFGTCPVCGREDAELVVAGSYKMCRLCTYEKPRAIAILKHRNAKRLTKIHELLDAEENGG